MSAQPCCADAAQGLGLSRPRTTLTFKQISFSRLIFKFYCLWSSTNYSFHKYNFIRFGLLPLNHVYLQYTFLQWYTNTAFKRSKPSNTLHINVWRSIIMQNWLWLYHQQNILGHKQLWQSWRSKAQEMSGLFIMGWDFAEHRLWCNIVTAVRMYSRKNHFCLSSSC